MTQTKRSSRSGRILATGLFVLGSSLATSTVSSAQATTVASGATARQSIEDLTAQWASLERPLVGVSDLTDLQRDAIELLEDRYRTSFNDEAGPIRSARAMLMRKGPFDRHGVERALDRMTELRKKELAQLRTLLTDAQRVRYDANLKQLEAEEAAAQQVRDREAAFVTP